MRTTITIRAEASLRDALVERAKARGVSVSALIREILLQAVVEGPIEARAGHLKGRLDLARRTDASWRQRLRQRNWRS